MDMDRDELGRPNREQEQREQEHKLTRQSMLTGLAAAGAGALVAGAPIPALAGGAPTTPSGGALPSAPPAATGQVNQGTGPVMAFVLSHEQFPVPELVRYGAAAERAGFDAIWTSDHFQPWQANEGHAGLAWVTLAALGQHVSRIHMGTGVTCPIFRYRPAVVAEAFASLSLLSPGRIFLGLGTGEKLNEGAAGGGWATYRERAARLIEAVQIIRRLWSGEHVTFSGKYWQVDGRLYDPPTARIPLYIAAGGPKSAYLSGRYADGLIADPAQLSDNPAYKAAWQRGARDAGKDPATMPILLEHFVSVSDIPQAFPGAEKWRFTARSWTPGYFNNIDPRDIQRRANTEIPLAGVVNSWAVSANPDTHIQAIQKIVDAGVTHVFVHSAQEDQVAVADFFGQYVLPRVRAGAIKNVRPVRGF